METHESKTQLKDLQSDISINNNNNDEIVSVLAKELETLVLSCNKNNEDSDQDSVKPKAEIGDVGIDLKEVLEDGLEKSKDFDEEKVVGEIRVFDEEKVVTEVRVFEEEKAVGEIRVLEDFGRKDESENGDVDLNSGVRILEKNGGGVGEEWGNDEYYDGWGDEDDNRNDGQIGVYDGRNDGEIRVYDDNFREKDVLDSLEVRYYDEDDKYNYNGGGDREFGNYESENGGGWGSGGGGGSASVYPDDGKMKSYHYPLRPDAEDCSYYVRTGMCKFGSNCKFNHPLKKRNQPTKETRKPREENMERPGQQIECKFYLSSGGCKYGKACKFNHTKGKTAITPVVEYNFLGLPIRPGEKECPYYMRNGSCKYGPNCRFNHPDPTAVGGTDAPATYGNEGPVSLPTAPQANMPNMASWSAPRTPDPTSAFVPMMYSPTRNLPPPNQDWNGYQAPVPAPAHVYPTSERGLPIPPAFFLNNPPSDNNMYSHHQQQMQVSDYPERPGQPDCSYFMKTGDCKYKATCKFHHPKSRINKAAPSVLSDKGLPLRPDQNICSHYSRYGICKYGPACKYDHPVNYSNSTPAGQGYRSDGPLMQQSV